VRQISSAENLFAKVEGDIGDVDGVLQITAIRVTYFLKAPPGSEEAVARILASYADFCPAYQSVRNCIEISWEMELIEE